MRTAPPRRATLKDVASKAGVSVMSASLAIRASEGGGRVSRETRNRVLQAATELGYRPDARARALRLRQTNVIGFYAGYGWMDVRMPFFAETIGGLQQACEELRKNLLLHSVSRDSGSEEIYRELIDGTVDGLVVAMSSNDPVVAQLAAGHLPVVAVADAIPDIPSVVVDDLAGAKMIAEHISELGHKSAVFAAGPALPFSGKRRQDSFINHAVKRGMDVVVRSLGEDPDIPDFVARARQFGATVIVAWNDQDARRLLRACRQLGIVVPKDMALVGFDGCPLPFDDPFPLTTVRAPWAEVARESVLVVDRLVKNEPCPAITTLPVDFIKGATT